jgi:hypothetical protein
MQVMMTFKVNTIGIAKTLVLLQSQYLFVFVCPPVFQFQSRVNHLYATIDHNRYTMHQSHQVQKSRAKLAMQFILSFEVNAIGTTKTFVLLQSQ